VVSTSVPMATAKVMEMGTRPYQVGLFLKDGVGSLISCGTLVCIVS
jgi:hypothetical protein